MISLRRSTLAIVSAFSLAAVACGSAPQNTETTAANDRNTGSMQNGRGNGATSGGDVGQSCQISPIYFAYDSSELDGRARNTIESDARCLQQRSVSARITGMTDPRGTEEYNLALGDRRARTVSQYMSNLGVGRVNVRSVGEEQAQGEDEGGWANDRRAEIQTE